MREDKQEVDKTRRKVQAPAGLLADKDRYREEKQEVDKTRKKLQGELKLLQKLLTDKDRTVDKQEVDKTRLGGSFRESSSFCRSSWLIRTGERRQSGGIKCQEI